MATLSPVSSAPSTRPESDPLVVTSVAPTTLDALAPSPVTDPNVPDAVPDRVHDLVEDVSIDGMCGVY
jgi:mycofactocin precursor